MSVLFWGGYHCVGEHIASYFLNKAARSVYKTCYVSKLDEAAQAPSKSYGAPISGLENASARMGEQLQQHVAFKRIEYQSVTFEMSKIVVFAFFLFLGVILVVLHTLCFALRDFRCVKLGPTLIYDFLTVLSVLYNQSDGEGTDY